jgi:CDP-glycerol glycerophosphotransferase
VKKLRYIKQFVKLFLAFLLAKTFFRNLYNEDIWLIGEKKTEARDNAYHFFKYVRENHPGINAFFAITKDSPDLKKVKRYGNIIYYGRMKHYIYFLTAKNIISSQLPYSIFPFWFTLIKAFPFMLNRKQNSVFLRHGLMYSEMSHRDFDYARTGLTIVTCSAEKERSFIRKTHGYPEENTPLLGLCRFDNLHCKGNAPEKKILIMPTFRSWLVAADRTKEAKDKEKQRFKESDYFKAYVELMNNKKLHNLLRQFGYKIVFYPHYSLQTYVKLFSESVIDNRITIADRFNYDVQELLISSSILITDFSSVSFDFAYMKKPLIYFQFDEDEFNRKHYKKGYFSHKDDGFGPVVKNR